MRAAAAQPSTPNPGIVAPAMGGQMPTSTVAGTNVMQARPGMAPMAPGMPQGGQRWQNAPWMGGNQGGMTPLASLGNMFKGAWG